MQKKTLRRSDSIELIQTNIELPSNRQNYTSYLRHRWVVGAKDMLAGKYGSLQNYKDIFQYSDSEWNYIWSTLIQDKAWDVPHIKDTEGNILKHNYAPELLIKYIAHDLKCHIVIIDLQLGMKQFYSANNLKRNNANFDLPILMYYTGNHFQSVHTLDHKYLIAYAKCQDNEVEVDNEPTLENDIATIKEREEDLPQEKMKQIEYKTVNQERGQNMALSKGGDRENTPTLEQLKQIKHKSVDQKKLYDKLRKQALRSNNKKNELNNESGVKKSENILTLEQLKLIKHKSADQRKLYNKLRKQDQRSKEKMKEHKMITKKCSFPYN